MKTLLLTIAKISAISLTQFSVTAQNILLNESFEDYACQSFNNPAILESWFAANLHFIFPYNSICHGLSYINSNGQPMNALGIPCNFYGCSWPRTGKSELGLILFSPPAPNDSINYWSIRQYVSQKLLIPLEEDSTYCFVSYYKLANRYGYAHLTTSSFGIKFTTDSLVDYSFPTGMNELHAVPDISLGENDYITDTLNWTEFKAYYKATGGEQFITMGNFNNNLNTSIINLKPLDSSNMSIYSRSILIFIDDIGLYKNECPAEEDTTKTPVVFNKLQIPSAFTPNNDGKNDVFRVLGSPQVSNFKLCVYNRWGKQVYCGNTIYDGWDGNCNGTPCEMATYQWVATYTDVLSGEQRVERGNVTLIR